MLNKVNCEKENLFCFHQIVPKTSQHEQRAVLFFFFISMIKKFYVLQEPELEPNTTALSS